MTTVKYDVLVVGSGCAGYNAADWLTDLGITNVALVTEDRLAGTSRNAGSDKQTYYKLSLCGNDGDSVGEMARNLASGGDVDETTALAEAACSVPCFMKLVLLGVGFPTDRYGQFAGYKTDHDPRQRATSAGPLTSRYMTEALEKKVLSKHVCILDGYRAVHLVTEKNSVKGVITLKDNIIVYLRCRYLVWCTGGPAGIYKDVVYPASQHGMSGILLKSGIKGCNLQHWQYGIASVKFRWNLSGTYQQVLPRYISIDEHGTEHEFLTEGKSKDEIGQVLSYVFMKGYQWPFDSRKIEASSSIDLQVFEQSVKLGRHVYIDYRSNPAGLPSDFSNISSEAYNYLMQSGALFGTPIERLEKMNPLAVKLYQQHGIDLHNDMLEINVCAQCHNGGILVDEDWKSSFENVYVAGEAAGTFGAYRPGGTALNSSQVGSMRSAFAIKSNIDRDYSNSIDDALCEAETRAINEFNDLFSHIKNMRTVKGARTAEYVRQYFQNKMSSCAAFIRDIPKMKALEAEAAEIATSFLQIVPSNAKDGLYNWFVVRDQIYTTQAVLNAMIKSAELYGSVGGSVVSGGFVPTEVKAAKKKLVTEYSGGKFLSSLAPTKPVANSDVWFERVWADYRMAHDR